MKILIFTLITLFLFACSEDKNSISKQDETTSNSCCDIVSDSLLFLITPINTNDTLNHFRGLFQLGEAFFISGTDGKILIQTFQLEQIELFQAKYTDLRDIHVLSDSSILAMGIASPGHIWKIKKGETEWNKVYSNMDSLVFMDGMDFWNDFLVIA